jgi:cobalamin-dependent methionine synthase I
LAAKRGLVTTRRYSPGYGDWGVSAQKDFLAWLGAGHIGIKLTESSQMLPEKSVSAILGIKQVRSS